MRAAVRACCIAVACALIGGCGSTTSDNGNHGDDMSPERIAALENQLRAKPSFEAAQSEYQAAVTQTGDAVAGLVPGLTWQFKEDSWRGCGGDYLHTRGVQVYQRIMWTGPIPDHKWPQALQIVEDTAARLGATDVTTHADQPGNHDVVISNANGVEIEFGTANAAVMAAKSDCRLHHADMTPASPTPHP